MTMMDCRAGNQRFDAPTSIRRGSLSHPSTVKVSRCGSRPRHRGSFARPASPWASFIGRLLSQDSQTMVAEAPRPPV